MIRKYWCLALAAFVYFWTLYYWFRPDEIDILWSSIVNYLVFFPVCGIILGIYYGRCRTNWKWILPFCAFIAVMIHDMIAGYQRFFSYLGYENVEYSIVEGRMSCAIAVITKRGV